VDKPYDVHCPESITGHDAGRDGRCMFCRRRVREPVPRPARFNSGRTELDIWYGRFYDPDYGSRRDDV
jgi:hypothetical protein